MLVVNIISLKYSVMIKNILTVEGEEMPSFTLVDFNFWLC